MNNSLSFAFARCPVLAALALSLSWTFAPRMTAADAPPANLAAARQAFEAHALTALGPLDDLRTKFADALVRLRQTAQQKSDTALVAAVDATLAELQKGIELAPSKLPDLERLRAILAQQTTLRSKEIAPVLANEVKLYRQELEALKAGLTAKPAELSALEQEIQKVSQEAQSLGKGVVPYQGLPDASGVRQLQRLAAAAVPASGADGSASPAAEASWPRTVAVDGPPEITVITEDVEKKSFIYRSAHYEFVCDSKLGANVVREFGRVFEATYLVNCKLPLDLKPSPEPLKEFFTATLFTNKDDYFAAGGIQGSAGIYMSGKKSLMVPLSSLGVKMVGSRVSIDYQDENYKTLIHETTHQMMNHWLRKLPTWLIEGSADFVAMSKYDNGRFGFAQMDKQLPAYLARRGRTTAGATLLSLSELMQIDGAAWSRAVSERKGSINYATAALLTYYFYRLDDKKDGAHIIAFFRDLQKGVDKATAVETHLLRERTHAQIEKDMIAQFKKEGAVISFVSNDTTTTAAE